MVPVMINQPEEYYRTIFESTNGLLIPGGDVSLDTHSGTFKISYRNNILLLYINRNKANLYHHLNTKSYEYHLGYSRSAKILFNLAIDSGVYFPIWGTCMGKFYNDTRI